MSYFWAQRIGKAKSPYGFCFWLRLQSLAFKQPNEWLKKKLPLRGG